MSEPKKLRPRIREHSTSPRRTASHSSWIGRLQLIGASAACVTVACSLITPLDYVGGSKQSSAGASGQSTALNGAGSAGRADDGSGMAGISGYAGTVNLDACNNTCLDDQICLEGTCCAKGQTLCQGACIDSPEAAGYCGACGVNCRADQVCVDATCICLTGKTDCGSACVDLTADPLHCGTCNNSCKSGQSCIDGVCKSSPCDGYCTNAEVIPEKTEGFRMDPLGLNEHCYAIVGYLPTLTAPRAVCWNFDSARTLRINGQSIACVKDYGIALAVQRDGWYCVQVSAGGADYAGLVLPVLAP